MRDKDTKLLVPDPVKAPVVRRIFHLYAEGKLGTTAIARTLDAEGAPPPRKQGWSPNALQLILANPAYRGLVRWNGETHPGLHEPLAPIERAVDRDGAVRRRAQQSCYGRLATEMFRACWCLPAQPAAAARASSGDNQKRPTAVRW
ncbi:MAG: recombinase family protein [Gaiellaceae bacterium]